MEILTIAVDFDGTCVAHEYPKIGKDIGAVPVLQDLVKFGHKIVLNTMRSGKELLEAIDWFNDNNIPLYGINENPTQKKWTTSTKVYAHLYIDDAALGCPLLYVTEEDGRFDRPYVNWTTVREMLVTRNLLFS